MRGERVSERQVVARKVILYPGDRLGKLPPPHFDTNTSAARPCLPVAARNPDFVLIYTAFRAVFVSCEWKR